jgi:hypothetical protein
LQELLTLSEMTFGSAGSRQARERFAVSNDPLGEFIRVRCRISAAASVRKDTFTLAIEDYCESNAIPCDDTAGYLSNSGIDGPPSERRRRLSEANAFA